MFVCVEIWERKQEIESKLTSNNYYFYSNCATFIIHFHKMQTIQNKYF
jgi:hypothetical protein